MTKVKYLLLIFMTLVLILVVPNIVNAATEEYTYSDTKQGIEWSYKLDDGGNVVDLKCKTTSITGAVTIPSTIDGKTVISLAGYYNSGWDTGAFKNCAGLREITIPNTITTIGEYAFENCTGLKTVTIPDSVTSLSSCAFYGCTGLTSVTLSKNLTTIGESAFAGCSGLKKVVMPNSVTTIGESAFKGCSGLSELTLSENLSKIPETAFSECSGLTSVKLPESVTTIIGEYVYRGAFYNCSNLEKILITDSVASIGKNAFNGCDKLTIYGNEGQVSQKYAKENNINFKLISDWDKTNVGDDITPPTVQSLEITYASVLKYGKDANSGMYMLPAEAKVVVKANFSEPIEGTTVPTLTIRFGTGSNIEVKDGTIGGSTITYVYSIKNTDKGTMTAVKFDGGDVKDAAGNKATLSCPELKIEYNAGLVYANGTATNPDNGANNKPADNTNKPSDNTNKPAENNNKPAANTNKPTENNSKPANNNSKPSKDATTATGKLPQTGISIGISLAIVVVLAACVFVYSKYNKLKGI